ncbi:J domain-containing protein [Parafilimonas terrae]|uniref:DnaJ domain-containing protein n=1 Tax=Parafilimonas terrae TaxID=1465490 RepID=A0A1I5WCU0_9BACT|nr:DnaJ domain-containing protein [Parafilimonas terrae]SFQ17488.1 DnaJ domain-containing protein [Parafilimonas terrae]
MAVTKDYYRVLNVKSSATIAEIKRAYRQLAMLYHPDKNPGDAIAAAIFTDAAEAYKVLGDTDARKRYNYERYLTAEEEYKRPAETIETLIQRIGKINADLKNTDPFRFNKNALLYALQQLIPDDMQLLPNTNKSLLKQFLRQVSFAAGYLSTHQTKQLIELMQPLYTDHEWLQHELNMLLRQQHKQERWEKYKIVLAVVLAAVLCLIIFLVAAR